MQEASFGGNAIVADDRLVIRDAVRSALGDAWCVFPASNGIEAIAYARSTQAALVILDINMSPLDGIEAGAQIRHLPGYANVPLVILTAYGDPENRRKAALAGVDAILTKPFTAQNLRSVIRPLIAARQDTATRAPDRNRQSEGQDILAVYRRVDSVATRRRYDRFTEWAKAQRKDSMR